MSAMSPGAAGAVSQCALPVPALQPLPPEVRGDHLLLPHPGPGQAALHPGRHGGPGVHPEQGTAAQGGPGGRPGLLLHRPGALSAKLALTGL